MYLIPFKIFKSNDAFKSYSFQKKCITFDPIQLLQISNFQTNISKSLLVKSFTLLINSFSYNIASNMANRDNIRFLKLISSTLILNSLS